MSGPGAHHLFSRRTFLGSQPHCNWPQMLLWSPLSSISHWVFMLCEPYLNSLALLFSLKLCWVRLQHSFICVYEFWLTSGCNLCRAWDSVLLVDKTLHMATWAYLSKPFSITELQQLMEDWKRVSTWLRPVIFLLTTNPKYCFPQWHPNIWECVFKITLNVTS